MSLSDIFKRQARSQESFNYKMLKAIKINILNISLKHMDNKTRILKGKNTVN